MKEKKGISLIVLIVTIIVMIIIAGAIILSLTETNIIDQAEVAVEKHNLSEMKSAASMAYADWLANEYESGENKEDKGHVQNYIRNELIRQGVASWEDFSKWYITPTGGIEEIDQEAFTYIVEIKEGINFNDKQIEVSVDIDGDMLANIEWGDGEFSTNQFGEVAHTYDKPGMYEIKVKGDIYSLDLDGSSYFSGQKVFAIKSFGNVGVAEIHMWNVDNLEYISTPNKNSLKNLHTIFLDSMNIQQIPDYFFENCNTLEYVNFSNCINLKYIPEHLFEGITDVSAIAKDFPEGLEVPAGW